MARPKRTRAEWKTIISKLRASGLTADVFATKHGLNVSTVRWWSAELGSKVSAAPSTPSMRELVVAPSAHDGGTFDLALGGISLRFEVGTEPRYVASIAAALVEAGRAC